MLKRILTAILGIPFLLYIIIKGGNVLKIALILVSLIGTYEMFNAFENKYKPIRLIGYISALLILINSLYIEFSLNIILVLIIIMILAFTVCTYPRHTITDVSITIFSVLYVSLLFPFIYYTRQMINGGFLIWLIFITAWGTDTFAYFAGNLLGKHKLAPKLSPNKTIEGAIGGILGAFILTLLYSLLYSRLINPNIAKHVISISIISALGSIIAQLGDLSASSIKRFLNVKDFGCILPGHGGILDRFDSVLLTAPFIYCALILLS